MRARKIIDRCVCADRYDPCDARYYPSARRYPSPANFHTSGWACQLQVGPPFPLDPSPPPPDLRPTRLPSGPMTGVACALPLALWCPLQAPTHSRAPTPCLNPDPSVPQTPESCRVSVINCSDACVVPDQPPRRAFPPSLTLAAPFGPAAVHLNAADADPSPVSTTSTPWSTPSTLWSTPSPLWSTPSTQPHQAMEQRKAAIQEPTPEVGSEEKVPPLLRGPAAPPPPDPWGTGNCGK